MTRKEPKNKEEVIISPMDARDVIDVFKLSNQDSVRANSFNKDKIELDGHKNWFAKKLKDENSIMLKASVNDILAGQVRLDVEGDGALIGVSVSEYFRGKGVGSTLIKAATDKAKELNIGFVEAYIKPENQASIKLFEKSGFVYDSETGFLGCQALRYLFKIKKDLYERV